MSIAFLLPFNLNMYLRVKTKCTPQKHLQNIDAHSFLKFELKLKLIRLVECTGIIKQTLIHVLSIYKEYLN